MNVRVAVTCLLLACACALSSVTRALAEAPAAPDVTADTADKKEPLGEDLAEGLELQAGVSTRYSTNLFREQRRRENAFDKNAPGERYHGMEGPEDLATQARLGAAYESDLGKQRKATATLGGGYVLHLHNAIANYFVIDASGDYDLSQRDRISLDAELVPHRFKKNYAGSEVAGARIYEPAYYLDGELSPAWRHKWTKRWKTDLAYELGVRRFDPPFANRNVTRHGTELMIFHQIGRVEPGLGGGAAIGTTPSGIEFGVPVDRSYRDALLLAELRVALRGKWKIGAELEYRIRSYTTDEPLNETYFDRTDRRWRLELRLKKQILSALALTAQAGWIENATNRQDHPNVDPEDLGYEELHAGLGVQASL